MIRKSKFKLKNVGFSYLFVVMSIIVLMAGCTAEKSQEYYHKFETQAWPRFQNVTFEIPINRIDIPYDIYFFAGLSNEFPFESIPFNMVMNTPSGEERIREYEMPVKSKTGNFIIDCNKDSCQCQLLLKEGLIMTKPGTLTIELENLIPKLEAVGISGVGIRVIQSGK